MARFDNKVVLVSGGARGQGAAEARLLVAQGAKVVIGDVLDNQGQALAGELGPAASFVRHDVTSEADWARAVEAAQKLGGLHGRSASRSRAPGPLGGRSPAVITKASAERFNPILATTTRMAGLLVGKAKRRARPCVIPV
jgi:NAD(P)-dependent dehydrogenase (short-subunit alcohol dehydrogenase family)